MRFLFICIFLGFTFLVKAQFLDTIKSVTSKKPSIGIRLESRYSFLRNGLVKVEGVRLGVVFQKKLKVGVGYSWLKSDVSDDLEITNYLGNKEIVKNYLEFGYIAYYADFVFHKTKRWQLSVPLQLGTGLAWFQYSDNNIKTRSKKHFLLFSFICMYESFKGHGGGVRAQCLVNRSSLIRRGLGAMLGT